MAVEFDLTVVLDLPPQVPLATRRAAWRELRPEIVRIFRAEANKLRSVARQRAPKRSGKLRRSIRVRQLRAPPFSVRIKVFSPLFYARLSNLQTGWWDGALAARGLDDDTFDDTFRDTFLTRDVVDVFAAALQEAYVKIVAEALGQAFGSRRVRRTPFGVAVEIVTRI